MTFGSVVTSIKIASLAAVFIDFQESSSSSESGKDFLKFKSTLKISIKPDITNE